MDRYVIRSLVESEIDAWLDFVARVFNVSRDYFQRHHENDPFKDCSNILVAEDTQAEDGSRIAATVKVFQRAIYLRGMEIPMGGIGEVSTDPEHRRRGLSGRLLTQACEVMAGKGIPISLLFAGLHGHYSKYGWRLTPTAMNRISVTGVMDSNGFRIEDTRADSEVWDKLARSYRDLSITFNGPVVRNTAYWNTWVPGELGDRPKCIYHGSELIGFVGMRNSDIMDMGLVEDHHGSIAEVLGLLASGFTEGLTVPKPLTDFADRISHGRTPYTVGGNSLVSHQMAKITSRVPLEVAGILSDDEKGMSDDDLIERLFPRECNVFWGTDGF